MPSFNSTITLLIVFAIGSLIFACLMLLAFVVNVRHRKKLAGSWHLPLASAFCLLFGQYCLNQSLIQRFVASGSPGGWMGSVSVAELLAPSANGGCTHVRRSDSGPVATFIDSTTSAHCGVRGNELQPMVPFAIKGSETHLLLGNWPLDFVLVISTPPDLKEIDAALSDLEST